MSKSLLVIWREYSTRVGRRSFLLMSILGPLIMASGIIFVFWLSLEETEDQKILVVDELYPLFRQLEDSDKIDYEVQELTLDKALALLEVTDFTAVLYLPKNILSSKAGDLYFRKQPSMRIHRQIEQTVQQYIEVRKLPEFDISKTDYYRLKSPFNLSMLKVDEGGEATETTMLAAAVGLVFAILIYIFIFMYSIQVMRGVIEEKANRIIEVIISTVTPFQLMLGKIIGVGAVGLTQFLIWTVLTAGIVTIGQAVIIGDRYDAERVTEQMQMTNEVQEQLTDINRFDAVALNAQESPFSKILQINFPVMLSLFLFYFLGGYFLYSAMMAAVGSMVDSETDTQQFVLPVTFPLIFAYALSFTMFENPSSDLAVWLSIIPFTSPVIMMIRVPFGIDSADLWQVYLSMTLLVATFVLITWLAGRIYRTGILMYGKKASLKEIIKWIKHS